nr:major tail protein [Blautia sp. An249]
MSAKKNKVKFNICNVHYALLTVSEDGEVTFGTPVAMPGAVSLSLEPNGEPSNFYADGYAYYTISNNMGYEGDLELAMVPEGFRTDVLKESLDDNSVLVESANVETANFALLFEFGGYGGPAGEWLCEGPCRGQHDGYGLRWLVYLGVYADRGGG